MGFNSAFKGLT